MEKLTKTMMKEVASMQATAAWQANKATDPKSAPLPHVCHDAEKDRERSLKRNVSTHSQVLRSQAFPFPQRERRKPASETPSQPRIPSCIDAAKSHLQCLHR